MIFFSKFNKASKKEGTSKTFGQFVIFGGKSETTKQHMVDSTNEQTFAAGVTTVVVNSVSSVEENLDTVKSQIALAAASGIKSTIIAVGNGEGSAGETDIGKLTNTVKLAAFVVNSKTKTPDEIKDIILESSKMDMAITMKSRESHVIEFNNLDVPDIKTEFFYQVFDPDETNITTQEDPARDPLLNGTLSRVPRFVEISWNRTFIEEPITGIEIDNSQDALKLKKKAFHDDKGLSTLSSFNPKNSFKTSMKNFNLMKSVSGASKKIVDIHDLPRAFDSISNKKFSIRATINPFQGETLESLIFNAGKFEK